MQTSSILGENRRRRAKDHWKKLAKRREKLKRHGNTLNANFRNNFLAMQKLMKEDEGSTRQDTDSVTGEIRVSEENR